MALEKKVTYDYEVRGEYKCIQQRERVAIEEDGKEISYSYHRKSFMPDADVSGESDEVKALASSLWTDAVKAAWAAKQAE
jgi:hypothetical protein